MMLIYLDSVICIYAVEGAPSFQARAKARLAAMQAAADHPAISDLTWLECRVKPIRLNDAVALAEAYHHEPLAEDVAWHVWSYPPLLTLAPSFLMSSRKVG